MNFPPKSYFTNANTSAERSVYPFLLQRIEALSPDSILDYGCGDGRLWARSKPKKNLKLTLYDPCLDVLKEKIEQNLEGREFEMKNHPPRIGLFDLVVCSLVLMSIQETEELEQIVATISTLTKKGGVGLFAITHPCFLDRTNSDFITDFEKQPDSFSYLNSPLNYSVTLKNKKKQQIVLNDVLRTLSYYVSCLSKNSLMVTALHELNCGIDNDYPSFAVLETMKIGD